MRRNLDDPLLLLAVLWFALLLFVTVSARLCDEQRAQMADLRSRLAAPQDRQGPGGLGVLQNAQITHTTINMYLFDK